MSYYIRILMLGDKMQVNRLFEIIYILLDKKTVTAKELAQHFEVSTRTIYRDIETLSSAGIPVYMNKGRGGGISLLPNFVLDKTVITDEEKDDILTSLKTLNSLNLGKSDTALNKIKSLLGDKNTDWIEVDFSSWNNSENEEEIFSLLKSAIINQKEVCFLYSSTKGETTNRNVEPLKLCFKNSSWYLYGYCKLRCDYRFFKLKRIKKLTVTKREFQREIPTQIFTKYKIDEPQHIKLKLKIAPCFGFRVYDEFESYEKQDDGSFIAEINIPDNEWLLYYINSFGEYCEVLEPIEVREKLKIQLEKTLTQYI